MERITVCNLELSKHMVVNGTRETKKKSIKKFIYDSMRLIDYALSPEETMFDNWFLYLVDKAVIYDVGRCLSDFLLSISNGFRDSLLLSLALFFQKKLVAFGF